MVRLLDFMLNDWNGRAVIDDARVGFFGFSRGGYTGLVLVGGNPDFRRIASHCTDTSKSDDCEQFRNGNIPPSPPHDARIRAAVVADPAETYPFTRGNLADIKIPLQVWRSELNGVVDASAIERVARSLPGKPDMHVVPAGHFAFLSPCSPQLAAAIPRLCTDMPPGFDRVTFHRDFDASILRFFREHLMSDGTR
jgi:predicted dienelactone hydrolase